MSMGLISCKEVKESYTENIKENMPIEVADSVHYVLTDSAKKRFYLTAPKVLTFEKQNPETKAIINRYRTFPKGATVITFLSNGNEDMRLIANDGYWYESAEKIIGKKGVVATNAEGGRLETDSLIFDQKLHKIYSNAYVKITTQKELIEGQGFVANENFTDYTIKNIKAIISLTK